VGRFVVNPAKEQNMTYQDRDPSLNRALDNTPPGNRRGWMVGGLLALAVIIGIFFLIPHSNDDAAINARPQAQVESTKGSAVSASKQPVTAQKPEAMH
jgi:hypothetical protein